MASETAILVLCKHPAGAAIVECARIAQAMGPSAIPFLLVHSNDRLPQSPVSGLNFYSFSDASLARLPYPLFQKSVVPGSAHFPLLQFFRDHPEFRHYWLVEHDVRFSGNWRDLFEFFAKSEVDFLTSHIRNYADEPEWCWWALSHPARKLALSDRIRSFNPIYRISRESLSFLHEAHKDGWRGHFEVLMPTLLFHHGFHLEDFGGTGNFAVPANRGLFYLDSPPNKHGYLHEGTMRFCPTFREIGPERNKLYHPVKKSLKFDLLRTGHLIRSKYLWGKGNRETEEMDGDDRPSFLRR